MKLYDVSSDGRLTLDLHPAQSALWDSTARFTYIFAGTQVGKTSFGPWWLWREVRRRGAGDYLAVSSTWPLFQKKMLREMREVFEHVVQIGRYWSASRVLELRDPDTGAFWARRQDDPMWGRVIMGTAEQGGSLESATALAAWEDECGQDEFDLAAHEAIVRRLSLSQGRLLGTTTLYNLGWTKTEVYDRWQAGDPDYLVVQADSTVNPAFPRAEFERARRTLPEWKFRMMYQGVFDRPAHLVYSAYSDEPRERGGCRVADFDLPPEWPRYVGVDFGAVHTATVWLALDPDRRVLYAYRETLEGGMTTADHARRGLERGAAENVVTWVGGAPGETQQRADWTSAGVAVQAPRVADVETGIDRTIGLFQALRLYVFDSCRGLRGELGSYRRKLDAQGQPTEQIDAREQYHRLDALRYVALEVAEPRARWEVYDDV